MSRLSGTVKWFSKPKGYGFIEDQDGSDLFVHYTAIEGSGFRSLEEGESVEFSVRETDGGLRARDVIRTDQTASAG